MKKLWTKFLVWVGYLSPCCEAKVIEVEGWNQGYCENCEGRIY